MSHNSFGHLFRFTTWGESHGPAIGCVVDGCPPGLGLTEAEIQPWLDRRRPGQSKFTTQRQEPDQVRILSGVFEGLTTGTPIAMVIENTDQRSRDYAAIAQQFRPGHADLTGFVKYGFEDIRPVIDRSSARETAARVAAGSLARAFLRQLGIQIGSYISSIGPAGAPLSADHLREMLAEGAEALAGKADRSEVRMLDHEHEQAAIAAIDQAKADGDTLGGIVEVFITGVPLGLGSYVQHDRRLDAALTSAIMSIQAIKGVEVGTAFDNSRRPGSQVHDELFAGGAEGLTRKTNRAGGIEGSMSNGQPIHLRAAMKPISSLVSPLRSFDLATLEAVQSRFERSDTCAVPAAGVVAEAVVAPVIANALLEKIGGDHMEEISRRLEAYREELLRRFQS